MSKRPIDVRVLAVSGYICLVVFSHPNYSFVLEVIELEQELRNVLREVINNDLGFFHTHFLGVALLEEKFAWVEEAWAHWLLIGGFRNQIKWMLLAHCSKGMPLRIWGGEYSNSDPLFFAHIHYPILLLPARLLIDGNLSYPNRGNI